LLFTFKTWAGQSDPTLEAAKNVYRQQNAEPKTLAVWLAEITFWGLVIVLVLQGDATGSVVYYYFACVIGLGMVIEVLWRFTVGISKVR
jgi:hypothetical protein